MEPETAQRRRTAPPASKTEFDCPACGAEGMSVFYEVREVPVHSSVLLPTEKAARRFPTGDIRLGFCETCGFIANTAFDPRLVDYSHDDGETRACSPTFKEFVRRLAHRLIERYDLRGKDILEIGCGRGEFLVLLCEIGENWGVGIDPGPESERVTGDASSRIEFIRDSFNQDHTDLTGDFICCRHTLEHIQPVAEFLGLIRLSAQATPGSVVFVEVPDVRRVLRELAFWDIYHEHCSYFSLGSLARLFRSQAFRVLDLGTDFSDQYLMIEAQTTDLDPGPPLPNEESLEELGQDVEHFRRSYLDALGRWSERIRGAAEQGKRTVIWGSGSKGAAFLSTLQIREEIEFVVDINPTKHGKHVAGTGQRIVGPQFLREYQPDQVIALNPIYMGEIRADLHEMGVKADVIAP